MSSRYRFVHLKILLPCRIILFLTRVGILWFEGDQVAILIVVFIGFFLVLESVVVSVVFVVISILLGS